MCLAQFHTSFSCSLKRTISPETLWMIVLCLLDLASTLYWVSHGHAYEANPLLASCLENGSAHFVAAKTASFLTPLMVAEWYLPQNPPLVRRTLRAVLAAYLLIYAAFMVLQALPCLGL